VERDAEKWVLYQLWLTIGALLMFTVVPLWYIPHVCLQQILWNIDNGKGQAPVLAYSLLFVFGRVAAGTVNLVIRNM
jgi:hypothetical protein